MQTCLFLVALDGELRGKRSGNRGGKEHCLSLFRGRDGERRSLYFGKRPPAFDERKIAIIKP